MTTPQDPARPDPMHRLPSLQILANELDEFKRTGRHFHLLHAVRALDEARDELRQYIHLQIRPRPSATCETEQLNELEQ
jgi:hypothetical protein